VAIKDMEMYQKQHESGEKAIENKLKNKIIQNIICPKYCKIS